jgi:hypothetical protein
MKFLSRLLLLCLLGWGGVSAQTLLPICPSAQLKNNCWSETLFSDGSKYVGEFVNSKFEGQGIEYDRNGAIRRSGFWKEGRLFRSQFISSSDFPFYKDTSPNTTSLVESSSQSGNLIGSNLPACQGNDIKNWNSCFGTYSWPWPSGTYRGEWKDGQRHGQGVFSWPNGDNYVGEYKNDLRNGQGSRTTKYGNYVGEWRDDSYHGQGALTSSNGKLSQGIFNNGRYQSQASNASSSQNNLSTEDDRNKERQRLVLEANEIFRLRAEAEEAKRKQAEAEAQLRLAQQTTQTIQPLSTYGLERRIALVIGNATYKINPLKNPVNDSTDMARSLRSVGFDVIEANNTTLAQMREVTRRFADKLGNSDVGLVYYSGHGVEVKGKNYLIPVNADIKREYEVVDQAFDASQFLEMMDNIRGPNNKRVNILIVDACRNNELQKSWRSTNNGLARMDAPGGTFISFATAPGRVAADGVGRNSPYTKHLLQALKQPNVPIEQVFKVVRRNVMEETKGEQIPWENSSLVGDFYFTVQR